MNLVETVRVKFTKTGRAKYISHLDLNRTMTRVLRRANIPLWYTEGFNRHPYITFAAPLSLGYEGLAEYMDFRLEEPMDSDEIVNRLNATMPDGITVLSAAPAQMKVGEIAFASWRLTFPPEFADRIRELLALDTIPVEKRTKKGGTKTVDIKPHIQNVHVDTDSEKTVLTLDLPLGNLALNPALLLSALRKGGEAVPCSVVRTGLLAENGTQFS
ncbi:MAG: DUF2344 domain-containing protein [Clostridia bacterium]|nr:DUF2344 domain-containing protein [Clostridia bacterium]